MGLQALHEHSQEEALSRCRIGQDLEGVYLGWAAGVIRSGSLSVQNHVSISQMFILNSIMFVIRVMFCIRLFTYEALTPSKRKYSKRQIHVYLYYKRR